MSETQAEGNILSVRNVSKTFSGTRVLDHVSLDVSQGEVHALLGQNGSGKSTLIKILSGYHAPDADPDEVTLVRGEQVSLPLSPAELRRRGIAFMHQDLGLVGTRSVLENLRVGRFTTGFGRRVSWRKELAQARRLFARFDLAVDPRVPVSELSQTQRAVVGLIRALQDVESVHEAGLLVLDEPTVSLPLGEVEILFDAVRRVVASGSGVLFVSHKLDEVLAISDRVSVLRDGRVVALRDTEGLSQRDLVTLILGRDLGAMYPHIERTTAGAVMSVRSLSGSVVRDLSFEAREGEILGLTGLVGAGHDEVPYLVYGASKATSGSVEIAGTTMPRLTPGACMAAGLGLLPADRHTEGAIMGATVRENITMPSLETFGSRFRLHQRAERVAVEQLLEDFDVRPRRTERTFALLSGGNQQKALLARWISFKPNVLMLHEPTQGVDVGSRKGIFEILQRAAKAGMSVIYASAEYEDLANVCDRVLVFRDGVVTSELSGASLTVDDIVAHCYVEHDASLTDATDLIPTRGEPDEQ